MIRQDGLPGHLWYYFPGHGEVDVFDQAIYDSLELQFSPDEEVVCISENDACDVDAIQVL